MRRVLTTMAAVIALALALTASAGPWIDQAQWVNALEQQQARNILARWEAAYAAAKKPAFAPISGLTSDLAGVATDLTGPDALQNEKAILFGHPMVADIGLPDTASGVTELRWPDGTTRSITTLTAAEAFSAMQEESRRETPHCVELDQGALLSAGAVTAYRDCKPVHVTGARATTVSVDTVDGPVTAPAWEFTFAGFPTRAVTPAIGPGEALIVPVLPEWNSFNSPAGYPIPDATLSSTSDKRVLILRFSGAVYGADRPCGLDYWLEAVLSAHAAVLILHYRAYIDNRPGPHGCTLRSAPRQVTLELPQPLGNRIVLDDLYGRPVKETRT
jgi:hypothetical protein